VADKLLLGNGTDRLVLGDGTSFLTLGVANDYLGLVVRPVGPAMPFTPTIRSYGDPVVQGSGVTVSLTGQAVNAALGTSGVQVNINLSGQTVSGATGTLTPNRSVVVTGQAGATASGTVTPSIAIALAGQSVSSATGTITPTNAVDVALTGQAITSTVGTIVSGSTISLTGIGGTFGTGSISAGTAIASIQGITIRPVGPALPFTPTIRGFTATPGNVTVILNGQLMTAVAGTVGSSSWQLVPSRISNAQMGPAFDFQPSIRAYTTIASPDVTVSLTGQSVATASGIAGISSSVPISGQLGSFASGTINASIAGDVTVSLTGHAVGLSAGALSVFNAPTFIGTSGSFSAGSLALGSGEILTGHVGTISSGTVTPAVSVTLSGTTVALAAGTITAVTDDGVIVDLSGQDVTVASGSLTSSRTVDLVGKQAIFAGSFMTPSGGSSLAWGGSRILVYVVGASGRTKWVDYIPIKYHALPNNQKVNRYEDDGALGVTTITSTVGMREWVEYIPVVVVSDVKGWRYDDDGYIRVVEVS